MKYPLWNTVQTAKKSGIYDFEGIWEITLEAFLMNLLPLVWDGLGVAVAHPIDKILAYGQLIVNLGQNQ